MSYWLEKPWSFSYLKGHHRKSSVGNTVLESWFGMTISHMLQQVAFQFCLLVTIWTLEVWLLATFLTSMTNQRSLPNIYLPTVWTWKVTNTGIQAIFRAVMWRDGRKLKVETCVILHAIDPWRWVERFIML